MKIFQMGQNGESRLAYVVLSLASVLVLTTGAFFVLSVQQGRLNQEFNQFICGSLASYTDAQKQRMVGKIEDVRNTLSGVTVMTEAAGLFPDDKKLQICLDRLNDRNPDFEIDYVALERLKEEEFLEEDPGLYEQVLKGEGSISDIRHFGGPEKGDYFTVAQPIARHGLVEGLLLTRINAKMLTDTGNQSAPYKRIHSLIVKPDGTILYSDAGQYASDGNLFSSIEKNGIEEHYLNQIMERFESSGSFTASFPGKGKSYYVSVAAVGINDWSIVNFVRSPDVLLRSEYIFNIFMGTGILLIVLTLAVSGTVGLMFMRQRQKLQMEAQRYAVLSQFTDTLLFEYDYAADIMEFTSNARKKLSLNSLRIKGFLGSDRGCRLMHPDDWKHGEWLRWALLGCKQDEVRYSRLRLKSAAGEYRWFSCQYKILPGASKRKCRMVGKLEDIMLQLGREEMLMDRARKDPLTGVYNRSGEQIIDGKLASGKKGLFFMIDLDNFKDINDTYGHAAGDMVLTWVAGELDKLFGDDGVVARVGGDEFVVFVPEVWDRGRTSEMAEAILKAVRKPEAEDLADITVSASIGIAAAPEAGETYGELYCAADKAMYYIKQNEKEGYAFCGDEAVNDPRGGLCT
ncbi:diguanylate cyclase [Lachnospiraceae bacterium 54-53]